MTPRALLGAAGLVVLVAVAAVWGANIPIGETLLHVPPLFAQWRPRGGALIALPVIVGALIVWRGPIAARTMAWRNLLGATVLAAAVWGIALALVDGPSGLTHGMLGRHPYLNVLAQIDSPAVFLDTFVERIREYPLHVRAHPPLMPLAFWGLDAIGLGSVHVATGLLIGAGALTPAAALVAARNMAGEGAARRAAPFLVLLPAAIWAVTSLDALYAAVAAWGIALFVLATGRSGTGGDTLGLGAGVLLALATFLTYGAAALGFLVLTVAAFRRRIRPLITGALGGLLVVGVFFGLGFWIVDGLDATQTEYFIGAGSDRPYTYFLVANLAAVGIALGPASTAGLAVLRDPKVWAIVAGALGAIVAADLSGLSKAEVERIWLLFVPWVAIATVALRERVRVWLGLQAATAIAVQVLLFSPW